MDDSILALMVKAAEKSAQIIRKDFCQSKNYQYKTSHIDIVTKTDFDSQSCIHNYLISGMKDLGINEEEIGFIEEENGKNFIKKHNFIVDPLDGTTNFTSGIPICCISIGYSLNQEIKIGVALNPFSNTLYWGIKGRGSFVKDKLFGKRHLQLLAKPTKSWIVSGHLNGLDVFLDQFKIYQNIYPHVRGFRNIGSLVLDLCLTAENVLDVVLNKGCSVWDIAAAGLILSESGGQLYNDLGQGLQIDLVDTKKKYYLYACHPDLKEEVLSFLSLDLEV